MQSAIDIKQAIAASPLFCCCGLEACHFVPRSYSEGMLVSDRLSGRPCAGLIGAGVIDVYGAAPDGGEVALCQLVAGGVFGVDSLFAEVELPVTLRCRENAMVLLAPKDELLRAASERSERLMYCARYCNEERRFLKGCAQRASGQPCRDRLLAYLVEQSDDMGMLSLQVSKEQLVQSLGIAYASLLQELDALQSERQIAVAGASVLLLNKDALAKQLSI